MNSFFYFFVRFWSMNTWLFVARHSLAHTQNALEVNVRVLFISALMHFTISHLAKERSSIGAMNRLLSTAIGAWIRSKDAKETLSRTTVEKTGSEFHSVCVSMWDYFLAKMLSGPAVVVAVCYSWLCRSYIHVEIRQIYYIESTSHFNKVDQNKWALNFTYAIRCRLRSAYTLYEYESEY